MRTRAIVCSSVFAGVLAAALVASPLARAGDPDDPPRLSAGRAGVQPVDRFGRPVVDANGGRITYDSHPSGMPPRARARRSRPVTDEPSAVPTLFTVDWRMKVLGSGIGAAGLRVADIDNDGVPEIVVGSGGDDRYVSVLTRSGQGYDVEWQSPELREAITSLTVANVDADPALEIALLAVDTSTSGWPTSILVFDGATHALERTIDTMAQDGGSLSVADVDADGALEFVFTEATLWAPGDLFVYDVATGSREWLGTGLGGVGVAVGNVDADPAPEIVVGKDTEDTEVGLVINGMTHAVEWDNPAGFGSLVRLADLNADGVNEVIAGYSDAIRVFSVPLMAMTGSVSIPLGLDALEAVDVEDDGAVEIVYGEGQWGTIHVVDGQTLADKWSVANPEHGVTNIAVADTDQDGVMELVWGAGHSSSGSEYLYVYGTVSHTQEWRSQDIRGPFHALSWGDVDADGDPELVYGCDSSESGSSEGVYFVRDARTKVLEYQSGPPTGLDRMSLWRVRTANVDADPQEEIFIATRHLYSYSGAIIAYDGLTHAEQWRITLADGLGAVSLAVADVDTDGSLEVVAGVDVSYSAPGVFVYVYNAVTGALEWRSPSLATSSFYPTMSLLRVANLDADVQPEIVVGEHAGTVHVLDAVLRIVQSLGDQDATALDTPDRDGDGRAEIVIGTASGAIHVVHPLSGVVLETIGSYGAQIDGLAVADVQGGLDWDFTFGMAGEVFVADGLSHVIVDRSGYLGQGTGHADSLLVADYDGDGELEILVNTGNGVDIFGNPQPPIPDLIFKDGFESA